MERRKSSVHPLSQQTGAMKKRVSLLPDSMMNVVAAQNRRRSIFEAEVMRHELLYPNNREFMENQLMEAEILKRERKVHIAANQMENQNLPHNLPHNMSYRSRDSGMSVRSRQSRQETKNSVRILPQSLVENTNGNGNENPGYNPDELDLTFGSGNLTISNVI